MVDIIMPQLGETVTEGTVTRWSKAVGESVKEDEVLFEVSTDKVDSEVRSPATGYLTEILVPEGDTVDVGVKLAVIGDGPPAGSEGANGTAAAAPAAAAPADSVAGGSADAGRPATGSGRTGSTPAQQAEPSPPADAQTGQEDPTGPGREDGDGGPPGGRVQADPWDVDDPEDERSAHPDRTGSGAGSGGVGRVLSPVVRRLLAENGLEPGQVPASGSGGRITRADVLAVVDARRSAPAGAAPAAAPAPPPPDPAGAAAAAAPAQAPTPQHQAPAAQARASESASTGPDRGAPQYSPPPQSPGAGTTLVRSAPSGMPAVVPGARDEVVPFSNIRRRTAEHMVRSQATSAHTLVAMEVDFEAVEAARRAHKSRFLAEEGIKLTYLPFIARALADAIAAFPHLNASVGDDCLIVHRDLHLGIAVDLGDEGLIVPVIHEAGDKRLRAIAREGAELATRARSRKLTADDISGGTFTITNPGPFGTFITAPIINQPQVAILSTDGVRRRPVVVTMPDGSEGIAIHSTGMLALSFDHRALDGAYASRFLDRVRQVLQGRDWSLEL